MKSCFKKSDRLVKKAVKAFLCKMCYKNNKNMYNGVSIESSCYSASIDTHNQGFGEKNNFHPTFLHNASDSPNMNGNHFTTSYHPSSALNPPISGFNGSQPLKNKFYHELNWLLNQTVIAFQRALLSSVDECSCFYSFFQFQRSDLL